MFNLLFWFVAVPAMVAGLMSVWKERSPDIRNLATLSLLTILAWHLAAFLELRFIPTKLAPWMEIVSIGIGLVFVVYGFQTPRTFLATILGGIGCLIVLGHSGVLLGTDSCYYLC